MPTYRVTDPQSGKTLRLTGDSPPTEQELRQVFGATQAPQQPKTLGGFAGNVVKSGAQFVGDTANALIHPIATVKNVASAVGTTEGRRAIGDYYKQRYGQNLGKTLYEDPVGVLADASTILGGAGAVLKGVGTVGKVSALSKAGKVASTASKITDPIRAVSKVFRRVPGSKAVAKVGGKLESAADDLVTKGLGNPAKQADLARKSGKGVGQFIEQYDLWDRSPESAANATKDILKSYDDLALKGGKTTSTADILRQINREISNLSEGSWKFSDTNKAIIAELRRRRGQILEAANYGSQVGIDNVTRYRRALDTDIPRSMFGLDPRGAGKATGAKKTRDILRSTINASDPNLERLGLDYGMSKGLEDVFRKAQSRANNRQLISLSKLGTTGVGGMLGGLPGALVGYATDAIASDPRFLKAASQTLKTTGRNLKKGKMPKAPVWAKKTYQAGKAGRMFNRPSSSSR